MCSFTREEHCDFRMLRSLFTSLIDFTSVVWTCSDSYVTSRKRANELGILLDEVELRVELVERRHVLVVDVSLRGTRERRDTSMRTFTMLGLMATLLMNPRITPSISRLFWSFCDRSTLWFYESVQPNRITWRVRISFATPERSFWYT